MAALELIVVVVILLAAATIAVPIFLQRRDVNRIAVTVSRLQALKEAIVGTPLWRQRGARSAFGFVGDLGCLPAGLDELVINPLLAGAPKYPLHQRAAAQPVFFGWHGPYLNSSQSSGQYVALLDGWGNPFVYIDVDGDPATWERRIYSLGPNMNDDGGLNDPSSGADDLACDIADSDTRVTVNGNFLQRDHITHLTQEDRLTIFFPNGSAGLTSVDLTPVGNTTFPAPTPGVPQFDSGDPARTAISDPNWQRLPIGVRYFTSNVLGFRKIAPLNGNGSARVDFIGEGVVTPPAFFELTFDPSDDTANNPWSSRSIPLGGGWVMNNNGYLTNMGGISGGPNPSDYLLQFTSPHDGNYRIEVNATLADYPGYGIVYRWDQLYTAAGYPRNGYTFQYDPGHYPSGIDFIIYDWSGGSPAALQYARQNWTPAQKFGISHQLSVSVVGNRHITKVDGVERLDLPDLINPWNSGHCGLRIWRGGYANYPVVRIHHVLIHAIPPLSSGEVAWWSFEEGDGTTFYGSGFAFDGPEHNGSMGSGVTRASRGIFGSAFQGGRNNAGTTITHHSELNPNPAFSYEAWVRPSDTNQQAHIAVKGVRRNSGHGLYQMPGNSANSSGWNGQVETTTGLQNLAWGGAQPQPNTWYHLLLTCDGNRAILYVDGSERNRLDLTGTILGNSSDLIIGRDFQGLIDEIFIYNRALSASEVQSRFDKRRNNRW